MIITETGRQDHSCSHVHLRNLLLPSLCFPRYACHRLVHNSGSGNQVVAPTSEPSGRAAPPDSPSRAISHGLDRLPSRVGLAYSRHSRSLCPPATTKPMPRLPSSVRRGHALVTWHLNLMALLKAQQVGAWHGVAAHLYKVEPSRKRALPAGPLREPVWSGLELA